MVPLNERNPDEQLDALFRAYRDACPAPELSANFMPELWQRIEAGQRTTLFFGRVARGFVTAAMALALAMSVYLSAPRSNSSGNYIDMLAASHSDVSDLDDALGLVNSTADEL